MNQEDIAFFGGRAGDKGAFAARVARYRDLLARKWWVLLAGLALGLALAFGLPLLSAPAFVSSGRMIVSIKLALPEGSVYNEELSNFLGTQASLMQSGVVLNRAQGRVLALRAGITNLAVNLRISVSPKTSIFVLETVGADPLCAQAFLQACMEEYIKLKREMRDQTSDTTVAGLTEQVLRLEKDLRHSDEDMVLFQQSNSVVLLQEQGNSAGAYLAALNHRLAALKSELTLLDSLTPDQAIEPRETLGTTLALDDIPGTSTAPLNPQPFGSDYLQARQHLQLLQAEQQDLALYLRPRHPKIIALAEDIARGQRLLEIYRQQNRQQLENRKSALALQITNLQNDIQEWDAKALDISRKSAEFQRLKANSQRVQALYDRLLGALQTLDVNKGISPETVTILEPASLAVPRQASLPSRLLTACVIAAGFTLGLFLLLDHLDDRVNGLTDLHDCFDESVLVQIPRLRGHTVDLLRPLDTRHAFVEAFRNLRSSLLYMNRSARRPNVLLLTSSIPGEGKSLITANLGITLAQAGARVLLVDADLRKGLLHHLFDIQAEAGLCQVLGGGLNWEQAVRRTKVPNLSLLPRGQLAQEPGELFIGAGVQRFLKESGANYDFVLLDSPPVMAADDVTSLAPHAHAILFVLRAERASARLAHAALDLLYQRQVRVLGIILNAVRPRSADYFYYHKYKDYLAAPRA